VAAKADVVHAPAYALALCEVKRLAALFDVYHWCAHASSSEPPTGDDTGRGQDATWADARQGGVASWRRERRSLRSGEAGPLFIAVDLGAGRMGGGK
jgi:hypothetical protein